MVLVKVLHGRGELEFSIPRRNELVFSSLRSTGLRFLGMGRLLSVRHWRPRLVALVERTGG